MSFFLRDIVWNVIHLGKHASIRAGSSNIDDSMHLTKLQMCLETKEKTLALKVRCSFEWIEYSIQNAYINI